MKTAKNSLFCPLNHSFSFNLTAGVLLWPVVFVMTDIINEYYGRKGVRFLSFLTVGLIAYAFFMFYGARVDLGAYRNFNDTDKSVQRDK